MPTSVAPLPRRLVSCLLDQIEGDRADQHAGAEAHDQPDQGQLDSKEERKNGADHERGRRQGSPAEGRRHQPR
jgi:hypothetical protein